MMVIGEGHGNAVVIGDNSHISVYERGGMASVAGVWGYSLPNLKDGTICLDQLKYHIPSPINEHKVLIKGVSLESS